MKVTSVIFLILSLVLIVGGMFICSYAKGLAPNEEAIDGPNIKDGIIETEIEYSGQNVSRIVLDIDGADVTIHGGAKTSYVKLTNFEPNKYIGSVVNKTLKISNNISIADYINLDGSGVSFAGVWRTLRSFYYVDDSLDKSVDIYLSDDEDIKQLSINLTNSYIQIMDVTQKCDITLTGSDSNVELNSLNFSTMTFECAKTPVSMLSVNADSFNLIMNEGSLTMRNALMKELVFDVTKAKVSAISTDFTTLDMKLDNAESSINTANAKSNYNRNISLEDGEFTVNGELVGTSDTFKDDNLFASIKIEGEKSDVAFEFGEGIIQAPVTSEPTTPETSPSTSTGAN